MEKTLKYRNSLSFKGLLPAALTFWSNLYFSTIVKDNFVNKNLKQRAHILMPSSSMYYGRISSPRLKILPLGLKMLCSKNGGFFHKTNDLC